MCVSVIITLTNLMNLKNSYFQHYLISENEVDGLEGQTGC